MPTVTLKPGHVRPVWSGHPWIFAQAIARIEGGAVAGDEVTVVDPAGNVLGRGLYTPRSAIPVRMFTRAVRNARKVYWPSAKCQVLTAVSWVEKSRRRPYCRRLN